MCKKICFRQDVLQEVTDFNREWKSKLKTQKTKKSFKNAKFENNDDYSFIMCSHAENKENKFYM